MYRTLLYYNFRTIIKPFQYLHNFRALSCWSCGKNIVNSQLFCTECNVIQYPDNEADYFKLLGLKDTFDIDEVVLTTQFKNLQRHLHPDKFASRSKQQQEISETYSSLVNEAYKTLLQPLSRGIYMLKLKGIEISENTEADQEFLMEVMERNEQVENAETEDEIMKLNDENKGVILNLEKSISKAFYEGDLKKVQKLLSKLKYYTSIDAQIQNLIRKKGIIR